MVTTLFKWLLLGVFLLKRVSMREALSKNQEYIHLPLIKFIKPLNWALN
jgi:hypothetical protein